MQAPASAPHEAAVPSQPTGSAPGSPAELKRQRLARSALTAIAAVIILFWPIDALSLHRLSWVTLVIRLVWAGGVLALATRLPSASREHYLRVIRILVAGSVAALGAICWELGGTNTPLFASMPILPVAALIFTQDDRAAVQLTVAMNSIVIPLLLLHGQAGLTDWVQWLSFMAGMALIALYGTGLYRRRREAERETENARFEALEKLATSERRRAEAERLALIGQLAAGVAHEINNPLAYVQSNLTFLCEQLTGSDDDLREALAEAHEGVGRIGQIVRDLRSFSRAGPEQVAPTRVQELLEEARRVASVRIRGTKVVVEVAKELPPLVTSHQRLLQVLINLLVNAADALEGAATPEPRIRLQAQVADGRLRLAVEDNGPGIPPDLRQRIFDPFFTTKPPGKGTGLGLSLSREYVGQLGGRLELSEGERGGALFTIELPFEPETAATSPPRRPGRRRPPR
jgi:signal transduction histidine kinase